MPTFTGDEAQNYDSRITKLVPGYELLHQLSSAQLLALYPDDATILIVGAGTGKEVVELAKLNHTWRFIAQDVSADMLEIADQYFTKLKINSRVQLHYGALSPSAYQVDAVLCLLVMHFVKDNGDKARLFKQMSEQLKPNGHLFIADLEKPVTPFERDAQLIACKQLGLSEKGEQHMRVNLEHEFFPVDKIRLAELLDAAGFGVAKPYFKALGFSGVVATKK
ncbi:class I SAM-dependent methyltransferase [Pseudoalteromonas sp. PS5]|uniref:class I SAM-dependent methyltransferase n=1 Tax=Pseudoalteromonas sp. PS5 TaxID=1437473 RepID=UPI000FFE8142|nr:class I SAM-dependent methyltransferase [Pseudoalteromonas sp. PS5]RXF04632.1 class I SAM-dependent methyltransferase [Pseudoalteromonas sp. PS5]